MIRVVDWRIAAELIRILRFEWHRHATNFGPSASAGFMVTSPPRPLGVSLRYFHHLIDTCGGRNNLHGRTTAQVCFDHIVPLTKSTELSLVDHLTTDVSTRHFVSEANWYVSHAWSYLFLETVDSLETFFADQGMTDEAVIWFCVFNNNQHLAHSYPFEYWSTTFKSQLAAIGNVVMIMHPWNDPIVLRRSWCVFEVYVAVTMQARFEMAMAPGQLDLLIQDMLRPTALKDMLGTIKSEASETTVASDRDGIFELIRTETSFRAVDRLVFSTITDWMKRALMAQIASSRLSPMEKAHRYVCLANIYATEWAWADVITAATDACTLLASPTDGNRISAKLHVGVARAKRGDPETTWRPLFQELLAMDGLDPMTVCSVRNAFADALHSLKRDAEIRDLCRKTYDLAQVHFGPAHQVTISAMSKLGGASYGLGDFDDAAVWFRQCVDARLALLGPDHADTLNSRGFLATIYNVQGKFRASRAIFSENLAALERTHGALHAHTIIALGNMAHDDVALGRWKRAQATLLVAASRSQRQPLPPAYAFFLLYVSALLYWSSGSYVRTKYYLEAALALCQEALPAGDPLTTNAVTLLYRFLLDPTFGAYNPRDEKAWTRVVAFFNDNELASEAWPEEVCRACCRQLTGRIYECAACVPDLFRYCSNCFAYAKFLAFCDHDTDVFLSHVPPRRYLMEQDMLQSTSVAAATMLWPAYAAYCAKNSVPDDEQARFASFEPIDTRPWHPML
ncbi:hypothetical protein SPRG_12136 [Saprolegnia parasitica CBS 223.65]|uniref:ZZ-type domain-containing protein n=1 Tax=Saprolegnia parasitica (strain CBS 223.65) TaxID=695850 RepID=A0A067C6Y2_SAPPC|nr:hypothetical protein SPRG_12136 [Saprolegnia parasitica CBS 223.65]KDO22296.1 hypothetical protein SPRG_12136 [Saprolegnia parasitica CBS 223.65]|eukprot:XP_012207029.1 hypothetical protein SPRG_12136 [Saprolegnia parasitica CBS 223.65]